MFGALTRMDGCQRRALETVLLSLLKKQIQIFYVFKSIADFGISSYNNTPTVVRHHALKGVPLKLFFPNIP